MDPLTLLREFTISKQLDKVVVQGDRVNFGDRYSFPLTSFTAFKKQTQGDYYTLDTLLFLVNNRALPHPDYLKAAATAKCGTVALLDKKKVLDYLDGLAELQLDAAAVGMPMPGLGAAADGDGEPAAKRARLDDGVGSAKGFRSIERQLRDRNSMLLAPHKSFDNVLAILKRALTPARKPLSSHSHHKQAAAAPHKEKEREHSHHHRDRAPTQSTAIPIKPSGRFERDTTADQLKAMAPGAQALPFNMYGHGSAAAAPTTPALPAPAPKPSAPVPSSGGAAKDHHQHRSSSSSKPGHSSASGSTRPSSGSAKPSPSSGSGSKDATPKRSGTPIILVPSGMTSMINMLNAKQFLEEGKFDPTPPQPASGVRPNMLVVQRKQDRPNPVTYHVTDKPPARDSGDWSRVVAVVTQGAKWQFKDFPFTGAKDGILVDTFNKVAGFFPHWLDEKIPEQVANWKVKRLGLHRTNRHKDVTAMMDFYRHLDAFLASKKSTLNY